MELIVQHAPLEIQAKLRVLRDSLLSGLVERDDAIRLALLAAVSGEHLLLVGPPGTAKSMVARRLSQAMRGGSYFERLLTKFSVPEELFGPLSIKGLEDDRYERLIDGYLPTAEVAFLDEIFKANSAILNALLTLLNEREFDNGQRRIQTPLISVVAASNELPEGNELSALYDRFLLRLYVGPVSRDNFEALLDVSSNEVSIDNGKKLTRDDIALVLRAARNVSIQDDVLFVLRDLRDHCEQSDIVISDRRWLKIARLLRVSAATNGRNRVNLSDCWLLQHCAWDLPEDREHIENFLERRLAPAHDEIIPKGLESAVSKLEQVIDRLGTVTVQSVTAKGQKLYEQPDGRATTDRFSVAYVRDSNNQFLYKVPPVFERYFQAERVYAQQIAVLAREYSYLVGQFDVNAYINDPRNYLTTQGPENKPKMEKKRYALSEVQTQLTQILAFKSQASRFSDEIAKQCDAYRKEIRSHLWVSEEVIAGSLENLQSTLEASQNFLNRCERLEGKIHQLTR